VIAAIEKKGSSSPSARRRSGAAARAHARTPPPPPTSCRSPISPPTMTASTGRLPMPAHCCPLLQVRPCRPHSRALRAWCNLVKETSGVSVLGRTCQAFSLRTVRVASPGTTSTLSMSTPGLTESFGTSGALSQATPISSSSRRTGAECTAHCWAGNSSSPVRASPCTAKRRRIANALAVRALGNAKSFVAIGADTLAVLCAWSFKQRWRTWLRGALQLLYPASTFLVPCRWYLHHTTV